MIHANGIDGRTGRYLFPPVESVALAEAIQARAEPDADLSNRLEAVLRQRNGEHLGLPWDVDPNDPGQAGWGVVVSTDESEMVRAAVCRLVQHRRDRLGTDAVKQLDHRPGESWAEWLARHGTGPGTIDPGRVPYYLLLVGDPGLVPFSLQYLLDVEYAVGRINFDDAAGYERYVDAVIASEEDRVAPRDRSMAFFGTEHPDDPATALSARRLVAPLAEGEPGGRRGVAEDVGALATTRIGPAATKEELAGALGEGPRHAVVFSATHGIGGWPAGHPQQRAKHGALLCQDWPGLGSINESDYFAAADVSPSADVHGMFVFLFACYSGGTPLRDEYAAPKGTPAPAIAAEPFAAALPKALLAHPGGGALAVVGHVERAWGYSFVADGGSLLGPFRNALAQTLLGRPVGVAMNDFNERYAVLSASLSAEFRQLGFGKPADHEKLVSLWTERNDAQNYILLGDPAVALRVEPQ